MTPDQESIHELFQTTDPEGLIAAGAPADEYDPEIDQLLEALAQIPPGQTSRSHILDLLADIWRKDFSATEDHLTHIQPLFESIADQLLEHFD
jgi:hypothetical protein